MSESAISLRFVALNAYPAIDPHVPGPIGGVETRAWMLARALAKTGRFHVDFVVRHTASLRLSEYDSVQLRGVIDRLHHVRESVSTRVERRPGFPYLKFHSFAPSLLWQLPVLAACRPFRRKPAEYWVPLPEYTASPPDIYCTFGVNGDSSRVIASAHAVGKPAVVSIAHDSDLDERYTEGSNFISPYGDRGHDCWRVLKEADAIFCQTEWQKEALRSRFQRDATIVNNPIDVEQWDVGMQSAHADMWPRELHGCDRYLLWVGRSERVHKRPQLFVDLLRELPEAQGVMILNRRDDAFESELRRDAPTNLRIVSHVPFPVMPLVFSRAAALVNTASLEGFPNVFLQAGLSRVPVISLQVGGSFLDASGVGVDCTGDWPTFVAAVNRAWQAPPSRGELDHARKYVIEYHSLPRVVEQLSDVLMGVAQA